MRAFKAIFFDSITLHLINDDNFEQVKELFSGFPDSSEMHHELEHSYQPKPETERRSRYGFYAVLNDQLAGLSLLEVDNWETQTGSTGADTLLHMRGQGVAPRSKPHLFFLAFELLGLNRLETGCLVSNIASKKSIEKTLGFQYEGRFRQSGLNDDGEFEDELRYGILREDWQKFYDPSNIQLL